jgi:hypothetical protein
LGHHGDVVGATGNTIPRCSSIASTLSASHPVGLFMRRPGSTGSLAAVLAPDVVLGEPKTHRGRRSIDLDPETVAALKAWKALQIRERLLLDEEWQNTRGLVFTRVRLGCDFWASRRPCHPL